MQGYCLCELGDLATSKTQLERSVELCPNHSETKAYLAYTILRLGNFNEEKILQSLNSINITTISSTSEEKRYHSVNNSTFSNITVEAKIKSYRSLNIVQKPIFFIFFIVSYILLAF